MSPPHFKMRIWGCGEAPELLSLNREHSHHPRAPATHRCRPGTSSPRAASAYLQSVIPGGRGLPSLQQDSGAGHAHLAEPVEICETIKKIAPMSPRGPPHIF